MRYGKDILVFCLGAAMASIFFLLFQNIELEKEIIEVEKPIVRTETKIETKTDTIFKTITKPQYITQTIIKTDTIKADTVIPYIEREYITSIDTDSINGEIKATVSGYNAVLDTLSYRLNIPTKTITNTIETQITKYKVKHWNWGVTAGFGYGVTTKRPDLFIGLGVQFSF